MFTAGTRSPVQISANGRRRVVEMKMYKMRQRERKEGERWSWERLGPEESGSTFLFLCDSFQTSWSCFEHYQIQSLVLVSLSTIDLILTWKDPLEKMYHSLSISKTLLCLAALIQSILEEAGTEDTTHLVWGTCWESGRGFHPRPTETFCITEWSISPHTLSLSESGLSREAAECFYWYLLRTNRHFLVSQVFSVLCVGAAEHVRVQ